MPSWTDRIQYHSLPDRSGELLPEPLDPDHPDTSLHNYHAVNDGLDCSDHSPIFATFSLQICAEEVDAGIAEAVEGMQAGLGCVCAGATACAFAVSSICTRPPPRSPAATASRT